MKTKLFVGVVDASSIFGWIYLWVCCGRRKVKVLLLLLLSSSCDGLGLLKQLQASARQ